MPGWTTSNLFGGTSLEEHFRSVMSRVEGIVNRSSADELTSEGRAELLADHAYQPFMLLREKATFTPDESGDSFTVSLRVPYEGDPMVLRHKPRGTALARRFYARLADADNDRSVTFTEPFPAGTTSEQIREWGKGLVDDLQRMVASSAPMVDAFNNELEQNIHEWARRRLNLIDGVSSLASELDGSGI